MEESHTQPSARAAGILGKTLTLLVFLGILLWIGQGLLVARLDGAEKQREYFGSAAPPLGLALDSAVRLPTGDAVVRFTRAAGEPGLPTDVLFSEYRSRAAVEAQMRASGTGMDQGAAQRLAEWERDKAFDWTMLVKRGDIAWGAWTSKLVIERSFQKGGGWFEEARIDLSTAQRPLVLCVRWPQEAPADEKLLRQLLAAIVLAPPGE